MSNMDFDYWNLNPLVLDKGEEVKQELLKYYELGYDEDSKTEETAYNEVKYIVRNGCNLDELVDLINSAQSMNSMIRISISISMALT